MVFDRFSQFCAVNHQRSTSQYGPYLPGIMVELQTEFGVYSYFHQVDFVEIDLELAEGASPCQYDYLHLDDNDQLDYKVCSRPSPHTLYITSGMLYVEFITGSVGTQKGLSISAKGNVPLWFLCYDRFALHSTTS